MGDFAGTFTAIDSKTSKIEWQHKTPYRMGGGSTVTAIGLFFFAATRTATSLRVTPRSARYPWKFQKGFGADALATVYEVYGDGYIAIATGGDSIQGSAAGDAVWVFSPKGQLGRLRPPPPTATVAPTGAVAERVNTIKTGDNKAEYAYWPARTPGQGGNQRDLYQYRRHPHTDENGRMGYRRWP